MRSLAGALDQGDEEHRPPSGRRVEHSVNQSAAARLIAANESASRPPPGGRRPGRAGRARERGHAGRRRRRLRPARPVCRHGPARRLPAGARRRLDCAVAAPGCEQRSEPRPSLASPTVAAAGAGVATRDEDWGAWTGAWTVGRAACSSGATQPASQSAAPSVATACTLVDRGGPAGQCPSRPLVPRQPVVRGAGHDDATGRTGRQRCPWSS